MFIYQRVNTPKLIWHNSYRRLGQMDMVPYSMWCTDEMSQEVVGFCFQVITLVVGDHIQNLSGLVPPGNLPETGDFTMIFHEKKMYHIQSDMGVPLCLFLQIHDHPWPSQVAGFFSKKMSSRRSMQFWSTVSAPYKKKHIPKNKSIIWIIFPDRLYNHTILWISVNICTWRKTCHGQLPLCRWFIYST